MNKQPIFSVLTPTWNHAKYLKRVHGALIAQTCLDFEWIVSDDGSEDDTEEVVKNLASISGFPIIYIKSDRHVGKIRMDNEAIQQATGALILWCDSDDWLLPNALQRIIEEWEALSEEERVNYVGLTALASTEHGVIVNPFRDNKFHDVSWNDLHEVHHVTGDMLFCARAEALKSNPFPEVDFVIPESVVWSTIGDRFTRLIPEVLKMVEYQVDHAISFSGNMSFNRGRAYALALTVRNRRKYHQNMNIKIWRLIKFIRYAFHGDISISDAYKLWKGNSTFFQFILSVPFALVFAMKDIVQGKVKKTHLDFINANKLAIVETIRYN